MCPILKLLPNGLEARAGAEKFNESLLNNNAIIIGVVISLLLFSILTYITSKWFESREDV